jgi:hypothetical protein
MIAQLPQNPSVAAYSAYLEPAVATTVAQVGGNYGYRKAWNGVREAIRKLRTLPDDWDGEGSDAPLPELVDLAVNLVDAFERAGLSLPTSGVATRAGTILFGWRDSSGYQEVEVVAPNRIEWMFVDHAGVASHGEHRFTR